MTRKIERSTAFRRDYKRESRRRYRRSLDVELAGVLESLVRDSVLEPSFRDHALSGAWQGCRECHIRPDLILIYMKPHDGVLQLVRLGSHSELFG